ncbi:MAG: hypothetical protein K0Q89_1256 [Thermomicrobiales bacterium]|nr:hypothetical protein [Thermomicrobiales bacterium]
MVELVAFVPGTHESNLRALLTAYLMEEAARLKQEFDFEEYVPTVSILPPASGRVIRTRRARSRWSSTITGCSCAAIWPTPIPPHNGATLA